MKKAQKEVVLCHTKVLTQLAVSPLQTQALSHQLGNGPALDQNAKYFQFGQR